MTISSRVVKGVRSSYEAVPMDNIDAAVKTERKVAADAEARDEAEPKVTIKKKSKKDAPEPPTN